jgi:hypothetical protein
MKKLHLIAAAALAIATSGAIAATATDTFIVGVTLTTSCSVKTAATDLAFVYTAFDVADTQTTSTVFQCSRGLVPTFSFDNVDATQSATAAAATGTAIGGAGVVAGLRYTLTGTTSKSATGTAATAAANGTADEYTVGISGTIAAGQAGDGAAATSQTRILTISY